MNKPDHKRAQSFSEVRQHYADDDGATNLARCYLDLAERHRRLKELAKSIKADLELRADLNESNDEREPVVDLSNGIWMQLCAALEDE